jgi:hypothetical protein
MRYNQFDLYITCSYRIAPGNDIMQSTFDKRDSLQAGGLLCGLTPSAGRMYRV